MNLYSADRPPKFKELFSNSNQEGLIRIFDGVCSHTGNGRNVGPNKWNNTMNSKQHSTGISWVI